MPGNYPKESIQHTEHGESLKLRMERVLLLIILVRNVVDKINLFLISSFRRVLYVVCFLLGNYPASGVYMPMFRNTLSVPFSCL